jgi:osmotically-inducible protein OsmY
MTTRNAEEIKSDVQEQLAWDTRIDSAHIEVDIVDGTVVLSGTVPTYPDRNQAQTDALQVPGVVAVDNRLVVSFPSAYEIPADAEISFNVTSSLLWSPTVDATQIHVSVAGGVVTLSGAVESYWQKQRAGEIAANTGGVIDVRNELTVTPTSPGSLDDNIRQDIIAALQRNARVDTAQMDIEVGDGVVTLRGTVPDYAAYHAAEDAARYTTGVIDVRNHLTMESPEPQPAPHK